jgi:CubicO group peptidase (beta-lactamase class C family)
MKLMHSLLLVAVALPGLLPPLAAAPPPDVFVSVPTAVQSFVDQGEITGAVMLVANQDQVLHLSAIGTSERATGRKMRTDDLFWIASMSKPITAVGIALLVDDGKLAFDDPVEKHLPEFRHQWLVQEQSADRRVSVPAPRPITIRDLLTHTSGLGEYQVTDPHWTLAEMSKVIAREPLRFAPGSRWGYSTAGIDVLGRIIEVVSGVPFAEFLQSRLFRPLGMNDTTFWPTAAQAKRLAQTYVPDATTGQIEPTPIYYLYGSAITDRARPPLGGAGLFSPAEDVMKFYQMMLNGGKVHGHRILQPATVATLTHKQTGDLKARPGMPWGYGFCVIEDPTQMEANRHLTAGTFGHGGAHGTNSWADPTTGRIYLFMIQRDKLKPNPDDSPMRRAYQDAVAAAFTP